MTALQDWLNTGPMNPQTVRTLILDLLRMGTPAEIHRRTPIIMQPGLERC
ncbi:hypothetical protein [Mycolicibacterium bacteremicum]|nr:hypothetical protein [Mycolicibacterium bacteremicum]MCV7434063.1 hypothetical protein [Mycolicibacterium bacteremicum]